MTEIVLFGSGNVASHLFKALWNSRTVSIKQVYNHKHESLDFINDLVPATTSLAEVKDADIYLLALKDDVVPGIAKKLENRSALVAHTSGAVSMEHITSSRKGVFYPLQTFSRKKEINYQQIPFCLEANSSADMLLLKEVVNEISGKAYHVNSLQRKKLHLAAVFVCNFVNYLYSIGENICMNNEIPFEILQPLIQETALKVQTSPPSSVQTGPALRNDQSTIAAHLELLNSAEDKELYQLLTKAIQNFHGKEL